MERGGTGDGLVLVCERERIGEPKVPFELDCEPVESCKLFLYPLRGEPGSSEDKDDDEEELISGKLTRGVVVYCAEVDR